MSKKPKRNFESRNEKVYLCDECAGLWPGKVYNNIYDVAKHSTCFECGCEYRELTKSVYLKRS